MTLASKISTDRADGRIFLKKPPRLSFSMTTYRMSLISARYSSLDRNVKHEKKEKIEIILCSLLVQFFSNLTFFNSVVYFQDVEENIFTLSKKVWLKVSAWSENILAAGSKGKEYWNIYGGPGLFAVVWFGSYLPLSPYPACKLNGRHTGRLRKRDNFLTEKGRGGAEEPNHTTSRKPGPLYINH